MLEGFFFTGVIVPGTLIADAGGILVQSGVLDFFDLVWFVAVGSIIGGEISFRVGRWMARRLSGRFDPRTYAAFRRKRRLRPIDFSVASAVLALESWPKSSLGSPRRAHCDALVGWRRTHGIKSSMSFSR